MTEIIVGQVWKEIHQGREVYVRVEHVREGVIGVRPVESDGRGGWNVIMRQLPLNWPERGTFDAGQFKIIEEARS